MKLYKTVAKEATAEQIIEKSRFITYVKPVSTKEEADEFIAAIKKKHKDATHNVPAMVLGEKFQIQWASDDGEPQGTSGAPIVQMLVQEGITNVVIVVTRYFGGIKLGTGGLVRAYTGSAKLGLEAAGIYEVTEKKVLTYRLDYGIFNKLSNFTFEQDVFIENIEYTDVVKFNLVVEPEAAEEVKYLVRGIANGREILENERLKKS